MTPEEEANRAEEASRLLENLLLKDAFAAIKSEAVRQWDATGAKAEQEREWIWRHYKVIANVESILRGYVESGRIARMQLQEKETLRERTSKFFRKTA
jgi:phosphoribosylaminoimidazole-succinocarboxamide synthase